jgi:hypothetical protein
MNATTHIIKKKINGKYEYFKVVLHPFFLMTELNSADPNDVKGRTNEMQSGDLSVLLLNGYKLVNDVNRISSSNSSRNSYSSSNTSHPGWGRSNSYRSRGTGTTKSMSTMSTMSSRNSRTSKGGKRSRNVKSKNKTYTKRRRY